MEPVDKQIVKDIVTKGLIELRDKEKTNYTKNNIISRLADYVLEVVKKDVD